ncbi:JAB domain-containing protein [Bacillus sp. 1P06AnD]|uniref:JAB domain-containing protein n=1 Tax=Bacillus sp. 1P06AnD TaxID=3132208 RepID=UPI0039A37E53
MKFEKIIEVVTVKQIVKEVETATITSPDAIAAYAQELIGDETRENMLVFYLNTKNKVVAYYKAHIGTLNASIVHPRDVFAPAILHNAASIIMVHNHPSHNLTESREDKDVAARFVECSKYLGIDLLDFLIVNPYSFNSFKEKGYI